MATVFPSIQPVGGFCVSKSEKPNCPHKGLSWRVTLEFGDRFTIFTHHFNVCESRIVCSPVKLRWTLLSDVWCLWRSFRNTFMMTLFIWTLTPVLTARSISYLRRPGPVEADQVALLHKQIRAAFFLFATTWKQKLQNYKIKHLRDKHVFSLLRNQSLEDNDSPVIMLTSRPDTMVINVPKTQR